MIRGIIILMTIVGSIPFLALATKIQLTTYLGIALTILIGSTGVAFLSERYEAIVGGAIISALWLAFF